MFTPAQVRELMTGHCSLFDSFTNYQQILYRGGPGWYEAAACWDILRSQLMRDWITRADEEYLGAGSRPYFWWLIGGHRLERIDGGVHPFECPRRNAKIAEIEAQYKHRKGAFTRLWWGYPSCHFPGIDDTKAVYETHTAYIERKCLWLDGEKELHAEQQRLDAERKAREERLRAEEQP